MDKKYTAEEIAKQFTINFINSWNSQRLVYDVRGGDLDLYDEPGPDMEWYDMHYGQGYWKEILYIDADLNSFFEMEIFIYDNELNRFYDFVGEGRADLHAVEKFLGKKEFKKRLYNYMLEAVKATSPFREGVFDPAEIYKENEADND